MDFLFFNFLKKREKSKHCTKTNSSERVEYTKAQGRILLKELGKIAPYVSNKEFLFFKKKRINKERR